MRELSLHILDILENSRKAKADKIELQISENPGKNSFIIIIADNGKGIKKELLENITDPFVTSRTTREVGLGLSLFKNAAERTNGDFEIKSKKGRGTVVRAEFEYDNIDRAPLGDIATTISNFIAANGEELEIIYEHSFADEKFEFDSREIKKELDDLSIQSSAIVSWIQEYLAENIKEIRGGEAF
ncbi:ATP-binding protein [Halanaerobium sp. Z-7514]|uniref:histidine kinase n=1 Tax=Halanaerobium polyolivorans TaxID=2886943 RepID=A0AAW4WVJ2_9FIRM|nr:ATP-binding protein [Halanaerobium polyolivorans]MCC3145026.1 ATP-binding protein [Halanaerobium polyolivorans]RQD75686.1 MAG: ATP-binding protein [Halanaerobium sp. MSAO_Bac5]